ncbi:MAG TPA: hypothetical protein VMM58_11565 [Bacteroidota bacterium]|nr:hypothetical protein [Bacteroidota bacterium]
MASRQITIFLLAAVTFIVSGCAHRLKEGEVVVIKKTNTYHREECAPTHMAKTEIMPIAEAKAEKFKPCPAFKPDSTK